jgi:hypothetical protein
MTHHMNVRMNQRGMPSSIIALALENGYWRGDKCILGRKEIQKLIADLDRQRKVALKALDKGGVVVVEAGGRAITTYRFEGRRAR